MKKRINRMLPIIALSMLALALVLAIVGHTYAANSSETPIHVLNYDTGRLYWAQGSERIDENGIYQLSLFDSLPTGDDGEKIISPGDSYINTVELRNKTGHEVTYTAVLYKISKDNVPIVTDISNISPLHNTDFYTLPDGVTSENVVRAVSGEIGPYALQSIQIDWQWEFSVSDEQDEIDTALGNLEYSDVLMGVWITVTDAITANPEPPAVDTNLDTNSDGIPDVNIDTDGDGKAELNVDTDGDHIADINIDTDGDGYPDINIDINGDGVFDFNYDQNGDGKADRDIVEITIVDGVVIIPPASFEKMISLPEVQETMTFKLDNFGKGIVGVDFPKEELGDFVSKGGKIHVVMTNIEVEADTEALQSLITSAKDTNLRIMVKTILPSDFTETELSSVDPEKLMYSFEAFAMSGTQSIRSLTAGTIKLTVPYDIYEGTESGDYKIYKVNNNGTTDDTGAVHSGKKFTMEVTDLARYIVLYEGGDDLGEVQPEPHKCSCFICLFGKDKCTACWICWTFIVLIALALLAIILKYTGLLNAKR